MKAKTNLGAHKHNKSDTMKQHGSTTHGLRAQQSLNASSKLGQNNNYNSVTLRKTLNEKIDLSVDPSSIDQHLPVLSQLDQEPDNLVTASLLNVGQPDENNEQDLFFLQKHIEMT